MSPRSGKPNRATIKNNKHGDVVIEHRQNVPPNAPGLVLQHASDNRVLGFAKIINTEELAIAREPPTPLHPLDFFSELPAELKLLIYHRLSTLDQICLGLVSKRVYSLHRRESRCKIFALSEVHLIKSQQTCFRFSLTYSTLTCRLSAWFPRESMPCKRCDRYYPAGAMHTRWECREVQERCRRRAIEDSEADVCNEGNREDRDVYRAIINRRWFRRLSRRGLGMSARRIC